jgi:uncharacterized protein (TIGR03437 family)
LLALSFLFFLFLDADVPAAAQTLTVVATLTLDQGYNAIDAGSLAQGLDGNFYGTAQESGSGGPGTVFQVTPGGAVTVLHTFTAAEGGGSTAGLILGKDGNLYGTTNNGVFKISTGGTFTSFVFSSALSGSPYGGLVQGSDGNLYGTTTDNGPNGAGTVFSMTLEGQSTILYGFRGITDGSSPKAPPVQGSDGNFYGTTCCGGTASNPSGTVYRMTPAGVLTTLYSFGGPDGAAPLGALIQASDGDFYGTTQNGGATDNGTIFRITPTGTLTTLYSFMGTSDGGNPACALLQASDGNFYGTSQGGNGATAAGTVFRITPTGTFTTIHVFDYTDGAYPYAGLIQATDGNLYGITSGTNDVFRLTLGSGSTTSPAISPSGGIENGASFQTGISPGAWITITGTNLSSITDTWTNAIVNGELPTSLDGVKVSVGGQPAYIYYISPTQINALAPNVGTGPPLPVTVTNANGTSSAVTATVLFFQPAFFLWPGNYAVATTVNYGLAVKNGTFSGVTTTPAAPGDVVVLWGTGFGPTNPAAPAGVATPSTTTYNTASPVTVTVGGLAAIVYGAALAPGDAGLYQVAIQIPTSLTGGDYPVVATISGVQSPSTTLITVQN